MFTVGITLETAEWHLDNLIMYFNLRIDQSSNLLRWIDFYVREIEMNRQ